jgi:hypothetical protein
MDTRIFSINEISVIRVCDIQILEVVRFDLLGSFYFLAKEEAGIKQFNRVSEVDNQKNPGNSKKFVGKCHWHKKCEIKRLGANSRQIVQYIGTYYPTRRTRHLVKYFKH